MNAAETHCILIPSYNSGPKLLQTVLEVLRQWQHVWVVIDGSTDGTGDALTALNGDEPGLRIIPRSKNGGKGAAVLDGLRAAAQDGFSHVLIMDADGQHPTLSIPEFMQLSKRNPRAMILGSPIFDHTAPRIRVIGRRLSNIMVRLETLSAIGDSLFGFRVYPLRALMAVMASTHRMRGYDFDAEAVVQLSWRGVPAINLPAPVRYFRSEEGGVSHFRYGRDNLVLAAMHIRLLGGFISRLARLRHPAVDRDLLAGDVAGALRGEEGYKIGDFAGQAGAFHRNQPVDRGLGKDALDCL
jgi:glycosyltransferase involved in cell wall biosynthesis